MSVFLWGTDPAVASSVVADLDTTEGVTQSLPLRWVRALDEGEDLGDLVVVNCEEYVTFGLAELQPCPGAQVFVPDYPGTDQLPGATVELAPFMGDDLQPVSVRLPARTGTSDGMFVIDPAVLPDELLSRVSYREVLLRTDGQPPTLERIRNTVVPRLPGVEVATDETLTASFGSPVQDARRLVTLAVAIAVAVGTASLTAATVGRMLERRRPFTLLRASGIPLSTLFLSVLIEAVVPLVVAIVPAAALGALTAAAFVAALGGSFVLPIATIGLIAAATAITGLLLVAATFPILAATTRPQTLRTT